tara:strand:- start:376 stop:705 length:330 start_codon:yes stop_codon:yes gene_type:complete
MKRLTVHLENQPTVDTQAPAVSNKKSKSKSSYEMAIDQGKLDASKDKKQSSKGRFKTYNTVTVRDLKDSVDVNNALVDIRNKYTIAICKDSKRSYWKAGEEMFHIANQK